MSNQTAFEFEIVEQPKVTAKIKKATKGELKNIEAQPGQPSVALEKLVTSTNIRADVLTGIDTMANSIRAIGLVVPLGVQPFDADADLYVVDAGHRRLQALKALGVPGKTQIPVIHLTEANGAERLARQWAENYERLDLSPIDEAGALAELVNDFGKTIKQAGEILGLSRPVASKRMNLNLLSDNGRKLVADGKWELEAAQLVGQLAKTNPEKADEITGTTRFGAENAIREETARKKLTAAHRLLRKNGFTVVTSTKKSDIPAEIPEGFKAGTLQPIGDDWKTTTPAKVKKLGAAVDADKRPLVQATSNWQGEVDVRPVQFVESTAGAATWNGDGEQPEWQKQHKAEGIVEQVRIDQALSTVAAGVKVPNAQLRRLQMFMVLRSGYQVDVAAIAEMFGLDVVTRIDYQKNEVPDRDRTIRTWVDDEKIGPKKADEISLAALALVSATEVEDYVDEEDNYDEDDRIPNSGLFARLALDTFGVQPPLTAEQTDEFLAEHQDVADSEDEADETTEAAKDGAAEAEADSWEKIEADTAAMDEKLAAAGLTDDDEVGIDDDGEFFDPNAED